MAQMSTDSTDVDRLLYPDLSYSLVGILMNVHSELGSSYQEKHYQRALAIKLKEEPISYKQEVKVQASFSGQNLGVFFLDFLIDGKIVLEIKTVPRITYGHVKQVLRYLEAVDLRLGIIANFRNSKLEFRRVIR